MTFAQFRHTLALCTRSLGVRLMRLRLFDRVRRYIRPGPGRSRSRGSTRPGPPAVGGPAVVPPAGRHRRDHVSAAGQGSASSPSMTDGAGALDGSGGPAGPAPQVELPRRVRRARPWPPEPGADSAGPAGTRPSGPWPPNAVGPEPWPPGPGADGAGPAATRRGGPWTPRIRPAAAGAAGTGPDEPGAPGTGPAGPGTPGTGPAQGRNGPTGTADGPLGLAGLELAGLGPERRNPPRLGRPGRRLRRPGPAGPG